MRLPTYECLRSVKRINCESARYISELTRKRKVILLCYNAVVGIAFDNQSHVDCLCSLVGRGDEVVRVMLVIDQFRFCFKVLTLLPDCQDGLPDHLFHIPSDCVTV